MKIRIYKDLSVWQKAMDLAAETYKAVKKLPKGSICELETQFLLCVKIGYLAQTDIQTAMNLLDEVGKMISVLSKKLKVTIN